MHDMEKAIGNAQQGLHKGVSLVNYIRDREVRDMVEYMTGYMQRDCNT